VPNPTSVTLPPRFNEATTPSIAEFNALPAWTFEIFASFAILSINSPLFIVVPFFVSVVLLDFFHELHRGLYISNREQSTVFCQRKLRTGAGLQKCWREVP
jgi:hypothetical protein